MVMSRTFLLWWIVLYLNIIFYPKEHDFSLLNRIYLPASHGDIVKECKTVSKQSILQAFREGNAEADQSAIYAEMEFGQGRMIYIFTLMKDDFYLLVSTAALITRSSLVTLTVSRIAAATFEYSQVCSLSSLGYYTREFLHLHLLPLNILYWTEQKKNRRYFLLLVHKAGKGTLLILASFSYKCYCRRTSAKPTGSRGSTAQPAHLALAKAFWSHASNAVRLNNLNIPSPFLFLQTEKFPPVFLHSENKHDVKTTVQ